MESSSRAPFVPTAPGWSKGLEIRRADGRPFADESGRTTLTADEIKKVTR